MLRCSKKFCSGHNDATNHVTKILAGLRMTFKGMVIANPFDYRIGPTGPVELIVVQGVRK